MTPEQLATCTGATIEAADLWLPDIENAMKRWQIDTPKRQACFLPQVGIESGGLRWTEEKLNYSAERLVVVFPSRFKTIDDAMPYARNPEKLANKVYATASGNRGEESGDGWHYRGGGLIQLTGRDTYLEAGKALCADLGTFAQLVRDSREYAALTAAWFWTGYKNLNRFADVDNFEACCKGVTGGRQGLNERTELWKKAQIASGAL